MALQALVNEEIQYLELYEKSPRLPKSIQNKIADMNAEEKLVAMAGYYIEEQDVMNIARAMTVLGFNPIEFLNGIQRDSKVVIFEGNRRLMAANLLLNPELANGLDTVYTDDGIEGTAKDHLIRWKNEMSDELIETLKTPPVIKFHPQMYTLESATMEAAKAQFAGAM